MSNELSLLEPVVVTEKFPEEQILSGDIGTIVEIYRMPDLAYEVEFVNPDGSTRALLTLMPHQVRKLSSTDVITTRPLLTTA